MAGRCKVCDHPERDAIDRALLEGVAARTLATRHPGTSRTALGRHRAHVDADLVRAKLAAEAARADGLWGQLVRINEDTHAILAEAKRRKNYGLAMQAIARLERQIELQGKILGELRDGPTVNVFVSPAWRAVEAAIIEALAPHPDIRVRVAGTLARLAGEATASVGTAAAPRLVS